MPQVKIWLFAAAKDLAGAEVCELALPDGALVQDARAALAAAVPALEPLLRRCSFAEGVRYVAETHPLSAGAELACIPPVSGG